MNEGNGRSHFIHLRSSIDTMKRGSADAIGPTVYRIVVRGELSQRYLPAFEGMTLTTGEGETAIVGPVIDQAQLHGLLDRVGDLGLELVSVNPTLEPTSSSPTGQAREVTDVGAPALPTRQRPDMASAPRLTGPPSP
jgi:hypothetical protein